MLIHWFRRPALLGLSSSATLAAAVAGCGGQSDSSTAVVVPEPNSVTTKAPAGGRRRPRTSTAAAPSAAASTSSTAPVKAEGWGTLKGQVVFGGDPPAAANPSETRARPRRTPRSAPRMVRSNPNDWLSTRPRKGVKFALVYLPKPTAVNEDAKKAAAVGESRVRPEGVRVRAPRPGLDDRRAGHAQVERSRES